MIAPAECVSSSRVSGDTQPSCRLPTPSLSKNSSTKGHAGQLAIRWEVNPDAYSPDKSGHMLHHHIPPEPQPNWAGPAQFEARSVSARAASAPRCLFAAWRRSTHPHRTNDVCHIALNVLWASPHGLTCVAVLLTAEMGWDETWFFSVRHS